MARHGDPADPLYVVTGGATGSATSGRKVVAVAGTAEALGSASCREVCIQAETDNTGVVVVGDSAVVAAQATRKGIALSAGDAITLTVDSLADLYLDVTVSGDGVTYIYLGA